MFYPKLTRRDEYKKTSQGNYYANYKEYYEEIKEDCKERCVYCDTLLSEQGGEGFHLDHFRPSALFPELSTDPNNLVLSCSKCNIFKSKNWHTSDLIPAYTSHDGVSGFIDPFQEGLSNHFSVSLTGKLLSTSKVSSYMIEILHLNRESRLQIRRRRYINYRAEQLSVRIDQKLATLIKFMEEDNYDRNTARSMALSIREAKNLLNKLLFHS
ncbi:HNH endonuclease [Pseudomonas sp. AAC]|uniref:HNH endonuclease n=1 Tax=Pseudomonas sp. AAC TaxID=1502784 RepID=UPI0009DF8F19|nr:HNH endonuclease [Pseudomonas sp. AAC]